MQNDKRANARRGRSSPQFIIHHLVFIIQHSKLPSAHSRLLMSESWTIGRLLTWTTQFLKERGAESPRLDAEILLAEALGCRRIELYTCFDEEPPEPVRTRFRELVRRRAEGMPVAYLVGRREFYSLPFRVTPDVLIPRPETELLVDVVAAYLRDRSHARVCDVGTGSGCVAVTLAHAVPTARVLATDLSPGAIQIARQNAERHGVASRQPWPPLQTTTRELRPRARFSA